VLARRGEPLYISLVLEGVPDGEPVVMLHYRTRGSDRYSSLLLASRGRNTYAGEIPGVNSRAEALEYYIVATGPARAYRTHVGTSREPISVPLTGHLPTERSTSRGGQAAVALAMGGVLLALWLWGRHRRRSIRDRLFWAKTLGPIVHLSGTSLAEQLARLAEATLEHPLYGSRQYSRGKLLRKLRQVRATDTVRLAEACRQLLGEEAALSSLRPEAQAAGRLEPELNALRLRLDRLAAASWQVSDWHRKTSQEDLDLEQPLVARRRTLFQVRRSLGEGKGEEAERQLGWLKADVQRLQHEVAAHDAAQSAWDLASCLWGARRLGRELLGRLLQYYVLDRERDADSLGKMIVVAVALARREALAGDQTGELRRRLRDLCFRSVGEQACVPAVLLKRAEGLRSRLRGVDQADLEKLQTELEAFLHESGAGSESSPASRETGAGQAAVPASDAEPERTDVDPELDEIFAFLVAGAGSAPGDDACSLAATEAERDELCGAGTGQASGAARMRD
jgi:hypothetical protein